jgi:Spy/CpxP family protein refolding chaperone
MLAPCYISGLNMKKILNTLLAALALGLAAQTAVKAQDNPPPPDQGSGDQGPPQRHPRGGNMAKRMLHQLKVKLNLTDAQTKQIGAILKGQMEQMRALHEDTTLTDDQKAAKLQELRQANRGQIRALLTPDQQAIFDTMRMGPPPGGQEPGPEGPPPPPPPPPQG